MHHSKDALKYAIPADRLPDPATASADDFREAIGQSLSKSGFIAPRVVVTLIRSLECAMVLLIGLAAALRYPGFGADVPVQLYLLLILCVSLAYPALLQVAGLYNMPSLLKPLPQLAKIAVIWTMIFGLVMFTVLLAKSGDLFSRVWLTTWFVSGFFFAAATRLFVSGLIRHWNHNGQFNRRAIIVGGGAPADRVIDVLDGSHDTGITLLGLFDDRDDERSPPVSGGLRKLGHVSDLIDFVRSTRVDLLIVTLPLSAENRLLSILNRLWVLPVDIRLSAYEQKLRYRPRAYSYIGNLPLLDVFDRPLGDWGPFLKSAEDKIISLIALVLLAPVMAAVALAVKLESKGPVIFKQKRYGFNNDLIEVYKFRSMYTDQSDAHADRLVTKSDPRVTRVGRFIRKTSLDELPQFFNVLKGDLSLVGPRPHATRAKAADQLYDEVVDGYFARHKVRPGITGWAQINGWRGETDTAQKLQRRVEHDLYYIENWSLTFDLYILARTPLSLFRSENAY
jgi:Undecaprenyl-phosphate glucose phosphotransferase